MPAKKPRRVTGIARRPPPKLTTQLTTKLVAELRKGHTIRAACGYAGLHHSTFYAWCKRGGEAMEAEQEGKQPGAGEIACLNFLEAVDVAVSRAQWQTFETFLSEARKKRGEGNWLPWMQVLERRWRDEWGRPTFATKVTGGEGGAVAITLSFEPNQKLAEELREK